MTTGCPRKRIVHSVPAPPISTSMIWEEKTITATPATLVSQFAPSANRCILAYFTPPRLSALFKLKNRIFHLSTHLQQRWAFQCYIQYLFLSFNHNLGTANDVYTLLWSHKTLSQNGIDSFILVSICQQIPIARYFFIGEITW